MAKSRVVEVERRETRDEIPIDDTYYYNNIKLLVAPYRHTVSNNSVRNFGDWSEAIELSWNDDGNTFSCHPNFGSGPALQGLEGTVSFDIY